MDLPETTPVLYNAVKHHQGYLQHLIRETPSDIPPQALRQLLLPIGAAQLDFYTGSLTVETLVEEVADFLLPQGLLSLDAYANWIQKHEGYRLITLSDQSAWALRLGHQPGKWVHLHPARYSLHSTRLKAHALKTALSLCIKHKELTNKALQELDLVNQLRAYLSLPPLSQRQLKESQLERVIQLLI